MGGSLNIKGGTLNIKKHSDTSHAALWIGYDLNMTGGKLLLKSHYRTCYADNITIKKGTVTSNSTGTVGLHSGQKFTISGGKVTSVCSNGFALNGGTTLAISKGTVKATSKKAYATAIHGYNINITGGNITATVQNKQNKGTAIAATNKLTIKKVKIRTSGVYIKNKRMTYKGKYAAPKVVIK